MIFTRYKRNYPKLISYNSYPKLISYNSSELPDIMNEYFSSIGQNLASKMPNSQKKFFDYLPKSRNVDSFIFNPVTQTEIEPEIMTIPLNKAHRLYSFPTRILR